MTKEVKIPVTHNCIHNWCHINLNELEKRLTKEKHTRCKYEYVVYDKVYDLYYFVYTIDDYIPNDENLVRAILDNAIWRLRK